MRFYGRKSELEILRKAEGLSHKASQMTFIAGRRRIGKTRLIKEAFNDKKLLYFFVSKKSERLLCEEYSSIIENVLNKRIIGKLTSFRELFEYIMVLAENEQITVAIDEFQELRKINPAIYSDMQNIWDNYKLKSRINLILCGSIYSMMSKIFEDAKEPLYGRADKKIALSHFNVETLKEIYTEYAEFNPHDFIAFYAITGGVAKYVELLCNENAVILDKMLDLIVSDGSFFLNEGRDVLIEEFGKDYHIYFSILSLISNSKTSRSAIESILEKSVGGYLEKLEKEYRIIKRQKPVFSKPNTRNIKYFIDDNFLNFWFRFIYKNASAIEIKNFGYVKNGIVRNFNTFSGKILEKYFRDKLALSGEFSTIGSYWDRKNENEIDIVALNEFKKTVLLVEVKLQKDRINLQLLNNKRGKLDSHLQNYRVEYKGLSLEDV